VEEDQMSDKIYDVPPEWKQRAYIDEAKYKEWYARSTRDPNGFWAEQAKRSTGTGRRARSRTRRSGRATWRSSGSRTASPTSPTIASTGILRPAPRQTAIIWEGDDPTQSKHITYQELHDEVCRFANILRNRNVEKGDRVTIYLPMIPEATYAMLACARIGAIHSVVFGGFSPDSLARPHRGLRLQGGDQPPTRACAAGARSRSRPTPTPPSPRSAASTT